MNDIKKVDEVVEVIKKVLHNKIDDLIDYCFEEIVKKEERIIYLEDEIERLKEGMK